MNVCRVCGYPMVWSQWYDKQVCCVYGSHPNCQPSELLIAADEELYGVVGSWRMRFKRSVKP